MACVLSAYLGTLDFTLLFDQENNCLHCTIHKAKVREISEYHSRAIGAPPPAWLHNLPFEGPDQKQLLGNALTAVRDVRLPCLNLVKAAPFFTRPQSPSSRRETKVTLRTKQSATTKALGYLFLCGSSWGGGSYTRTQALYGIMFAIP